MSVLLLLLQHVLDKSIYLSMYPSVCLSITIALTWSIGYP
jgi:hypothetical protein